MWVPTAMCIRTHEGRPIIVGNWTDGVEHFSMMQLTIYAKTVLRRLALMIPEPIFPIRLSIYCVCICVIAHHLIIFDWCNRHRHLVGIRRVYNFLR